MIKFPNLISFLIHKLSEEAIEVSHISHKTLMYGLDSTNPDIPVDSPSNEAILHKELCDLNTVIDMLEKFGITVPVSQYHSTIEMMQKRLKMREWLLKAVENGVQNTNLLGEYDVFIQEYYPGDLS